MKFLNPAKLSGAIALLVLTQCAIVEVANEYFITGPVSGLYIQIRIINGKVLLAPYYDVTEVNKIIQESCKFTGNNISVDIIDSGIDYTKSEFQIVQSVIGNRQTSDGTLPRA
jgi:hypothetical protein